MKDARKHHYKAKFRKERISKEVKIGHGGTLDPMATGVLILGVGAGTKKLGEFLSCTKSYDTVLLFGQATDTYDVTGKTVARKPFEHITRAKVEEALDKFRGSLMQMPPIYSSIRVQGKHLYEYAREGKEVPTEIEKRPVTVESLELTEWYEGGSHPYNWPLAEAGDEEKKIAEKVLHFSPSETTEQKSNLKRELEEPDAIDNDPPAKKIKAEDDSDTGRKIKAEDDNDAAQNIEEENGSRAPQDPTPPAVSSNDPIEPSKPSPCPAPACRLRMTVTSGFYVRSLCHDLGEAVGSLGAMASLVRTRQGEFELDKNVFEYGDLAKGEEVWAPKIQKLLVPISID